MNDVLPSLLNLQRSLGLACKAQHIGRIIQGRIEVLAMPREWVLKEINSGINTTLDLNDSWEYRRLLELLKMLDCAILNEYILIGLQNTDSEIKEAASDFRE